MADIAEIIDNFSVLDDWDDRYRYLIELGRDLPPLAESAHNDAHKAVIEQVRTRCREIARPPARCRSRK